MEITYTEPADEDAQMDQAAKLLAKCIIRMLKKGLLRREEDEPAPAAAEDIPGEVDEDAKPSAERSEE